MKKSLLSFLLLTIFIVASSIQMYGQNISVNNDGGDGTCSSAWPTEILGNYIQNGTNNGKPCYQGPSGYWVYHAEMQSFGGALGSYWVVGKPLGSTDINGANIRHFKASTAATPPLNVRFTSGSNGCGYLKIAAGSATPPPASVLYDPYPGVVTGTSMQISWSQAVGTTAYKIYVSTNNSFTEPVAGLNPKTVSTVSGQPYPPTTTTISGLTSGTTYYIRIRGYNGGGEGPYSNIVSATTIPGPPVATAATETTDIASQANWNAAPGATWYKLYVSTNSSFSSHVSNYNGKNVGSQYSGSISGLTANTTYYYRLKANNSFGESGYSNVVSVTTDPPYPDVDFNSFSSNGEESTTSTNLALDLSFVTGANVMVDYTVTGTATGGGIDYTLANGTTTINAGAVNGNITINNIVDDILDENNETVTVTLSNPVKARLGSEKVHTYTINDNDTLPRVSFAEEAQTSIDESGTMSVIVQLSTLSGRDIQVPFTVDSSSTALGSGTDYSIMPGIVTINEGEVNDTVAISIVDDSLGEGNETIVLNIGTPTNATIGTVSRHTATITDNDDFIPPNAVCQNITVFLDLTGSVTVNGADVDGGSSDNIGVSSYGLDTSTFDCGDIGVNSVVLIVSDAAGNKDSCSALITVLDTISPTVMCHDTTVYLDAGGNIEIDSTFINNGSSDACGIATIVLDNSGFDCSDVGSNTVVMTITDVNSNVSTCNTTVTVMDTISPTVVTQNITVYLDENGTTTIDSSDIDNGSDDNCSIATMTLDSITFDCGEVGQNTVILTVTDVNGNSSSETATVTVEDTISPTVLTQNIIVYLEEFGAVTIDSSDIDNGSDDNCSIVTMILDSTTFDCGEIGQNIVTLTVTDVNGNSANEIATVTVVDTISPIANCQDTTVYLDASGNVRINASFVDNSSSDACGIANMTLDVTDFDCSELGVNSVIMQVHDNHGNVSQCSSEVTVLDTISLVVLCQDTIVYLDSNGFVSIDTSFVYKGSNGTCSITGVWLNKTNFNGSNAGGNPVIVSVSDVNGNIGTCTSIVTIMDTIAPEARCQDIGITLDTAGRARIYPGFIDNGSTDEGGIVSYTLDKTRFYCSDIGENTVVMSVKDVGGNVSTCSATVTIADNWLPEVACNDIEVSLGATGIAVIDSSMIDAGSTAICGISGIELSQSTFTAADLGENSITMTVSNLSGITATCEAKVTVKDEISPVADCNSITIWLTDSATYKLTNDDIKGIASGSSDNASAFDSLQIEITPATFDCSQVGDSVKVEVSITDEAGNESTCDTWVSVKDSSQVLLSSLEDIEISLPAGVCETTIDYPEVFTTKPCVTFTQLEGLGADSIFPVGTTIETWEVDYGTEKDTVSFAVIVTAENAVPTIDSIADVTGDEDSPISVSLQGISGGNDCTAQDVSITASNTNAALVSDIEVVYTAGDTLGQLNLTLAANASGTDSLTVVVEDSEGAQIEVSFILTVNPVNDAPYLLLPLTDGTVNASKTFALPLTELMGVVFDDIDDDTLAFDVMLEGTDTLPGWAVIEDGVLTAIPMLADMGTYSFVATATDTSGATTSDTFTLEVEGYPTAIENLDKGVFELNMYPNPTKGLVRVETSAVQVGEVEIAVMNIAGAEVFRKKYQSTDPIQFDLSGQVSGLYMVLININGQRVVKKLILDKK